MFNESRAFFRQFRRQFHSTGSLLPSSRYLARALTRPWRSRKRPARILEVGPGTGALTRWIVPLLGAEDRLDLVELNESFVVYLRQRLSQEEAFVSVRDRVRLFHADIEGFEADVHYDFIISGLPLNNFSADLVERIFQRFFELLEPGGMLSYFEYMYVRRLRCLTALGRSRTPRLALDAVLNQQLDQYQTGRDRVLRNFPPAWAHHLCIQPAANSAQVASGSGKGACTS